MVFSYAPTIVSTLIENFLLAITRFVCLIMPFHKMQERPTRIDLSLTVHYESRPPYFLLFNTLRKRHYLLSSLIATAILANVLAVSFGGMFLPTTRSVDVPVNYLDVYQPQLNLERITTLPSVHTIFYAAMRNAADKAPKVAWTMADRFFLPFQPSNMTSDPSRITISRTSETWGFKADINCRAPGASQLNFTDLGPDLSNVVYLSLVQDIIMHPGNDCSAAQLAKHSKESIAVESIRFSPDPAYDYVITNRVDADAGSIMANYTKRVIAVGEVYHEKAGPV
jgi:hypothetical protein